MRLFFALPLPEDAILKVAAWRDKMLLPQSRWVPLENYHITLAFIGEVPANQMESLCQKCSDLIKRRAFNLTELTIDQTGYWSKPGILWIGPSKWPESLTTLNEMLMQLSVEYGGRREKRSYLPHITLARKCATPSKPLMEPDITVRFDAFGLFESINTRTGVRYQMSDHWPLN